MSSRIAPGRGRAILVSVLFCLAALRFGVASVSAIHYNHGDFWATLPGVYAERLNLTLWDSPDLSESPAFHRHGFGYGPTQYLTLWPMVLLDSYRQIAMVLLPLYIVVVLGTAYMLWRLCETVFPEHDDGQWGRALTVFAAVFLFGPLQMALGQREFEIVQALVIVSAAYFLARGRPVIAGALLGYISMFKYWVCGLIGYFFLKRQWKPALMFLAAIAAVLLVAHAVFDLRYFPISNAYGIEMQFGRVFRPLTQGQTFCPAPNGTYANLRMGVCMIVGSRDLPAQIIFYGLPGGAAVLFLVLFALFERQGPCADEIDERWRRIVEFCLILIGGGVVFHGHYYYQAILILPMTLVLYRSFWDPRGAWLGRLVLGVLAYASLSPFIVPVFLWLRVFGGDPWTTYLSHGIYVYGDVILAGLMFWEYWTLLRRRTPLHVEVGS